MKKTIVFILFFLAAALPAQDVLAGPRKVVFIRYKIPVSHFSTVIEGFKATMARHGYREGEQVEYIDILTRSADKSSIPDVLQAITDWKDKADMIVTSGWISMPARTLLKDTDTPQLFVPVLESVARTLLSSTSEQPGTNISGVYLMYPPEKILRLARLLIPEIKNYAYVYNSNIPADMIFKSAYEQLSAAEQHDINIHFLDLSRGVQEVLRELKEKKVQAFGGIVGSFQKRRELAASNLPVITSFTLDIEKEELEKYVQEGNMVGGLFNPFRYCGEQAGEMTAEIFNGTLSIEETVPRPARQTAFINVKTANRLKMQIPFAALESVDIVIK